MTESDASSPIGLPQPPLLRPPPPRKGGSWWKWLLGIVAALFVVFVVVVAVIALSLNRIVCAVARTAIEKNTGLPTQIESLKVSFLHPGIQIRGLKLTNTPEFGGDTFLNLPELDIRADRAALRKKRLHFELVRLNLADLHIVMDEKGRRNTEAIKQHSDEAKSRKASPKRRGNGPEFGGLDKFDLSVGKFRYTDLGDPNMSHTIRFEWTNEVMTNLTSRDAIGAQLLLLTFSKGAFIDDEKVNDPFSILQMIGSFAGAK